MNFNFLFFTSAFVSFVCKRNCRPSSLSVTASSLFPLIPSSQVQPFNRISLFKKEKKTKKNRADLASSTRRCSMNSRFVLFFFWFDNVFHLSSSWRRVRIRGRVIEGKLAVPHSFNRHTTANSENINNMIITQKETCAIKQTKKKIIIIGAIRV